MIKKINILINFRLLIPVIFILISCNQKSETKSQDDFVQFYNDSDTLKKCTLSKSVKEYIDNHTDEFEYIVDSDLDLIRDFIEDGTCPTIAYGDFNDNGVEDIAIILRYKKYKEKGYQGVSFPFLVIFNDYAEKVEPYVVYKTGDYADEDIKTVIYDQFDKGIFSYLKKGKYNGKDVVDIVLPEKSIFLVKWNHKDGRYEYLNYMDIDSANDVLIGDEKNVEDSLSDYEFTYLSNNEDDKNRIEMTFKNKSTNEVQKISYETEEIFDISLEKSSINLSRGDKILKNERNNQFIVCDINFDGKEDFAIVKSNSNAGILYAFYIQKDNKFELDKDLTENMGFFPKKINPKEKTLTISHLSGCCKEITYRLQLGSDNQWKEVFYEKKNLMN